MKKQILTFGLALSMVFTPVMSFADTAKATNLSLEEAYATYQKTDAYNLVKLENALDKASIKDMYVDKNLPNYNYYSKLMKEQRDYSNKVLESNAAARENKTYLGFVQQYYGLKYAEESLAIAEAGLATAKKSYETTQLKYKLGTVSKMEFNQATINYSKTQNEVKSAKAELETAKMQFNSFIGMDLNAQLKLTSSIEEAAMPDTKLEDAVNAALEHRSELISADYNVSMARRNYVAAEPYPHTGSKFAAANLGYQSALYAAKAAKDSIVIDVTTKYNTMHNLYDTVQLDKKNLTAAQDTYNMALKRYELGMSTLTEVQNAEQLLNSTKVEKAKNLVAYRLAVKEFELCMGAGTKVANIPGAGGAEE